jgi:hypothetical protein
MQANNCYAYFLGLCMKKLTVFALFFIATAVVAADITGDVFNTPTRNGNATIYTLKITGQSGVGNASGGIGGANVDLDRVRVERGAKTGSIINAPQHTGNLSVYSTGDVAVGSVVVESGAKTSNIQNVGTRSGDLTVYAGNLQGQRSISGVSGGVGGAVLADSVKVCAGATARNVTNAPKTNGKTTIVGSDVGAASISLGC